MRAQPIPGRSLLLALVAALGGCDNLDVGRAPADEGAPVIEAIWVLDPERPTMIDLLRQGPPAACSDRDPCPSSGLARLPSRCAPTLDGSGVPLPGGVGTCDDPTAASNPMSGGGWASVRVVLSRLLDPATVEAVDLDGGAGAPTFTFLHPGALRLLAVSGPPGDGVEVAAVAAWDPGGAATASDPYSDPPGPALTLTPREGLALGQEYAVVIDPTPFADRDGGRITATRLGPIDPAGYRFRVEDARLPGTLPVIGADSPPLSPNQSSPSWPTHRSSRRSSAPP